MVIQPRRYIMNEKKSVNRVEDRDENRDPITGAPGAHPVGTGVGAAGGGAAGAAIGAAVGGPIGAGIGIVAGAIVGGLTGKGAAEAIDPTAEDAYWRENYRNRDYVDRNTTYETYQPAYRTGYEGYSQHSDRRYEDVESDLRRNYESAAGTAGLAWDKARHATRDAWRRLEERRAERRATGAAGTGTTGLAGTTEQNYPSQTDSPKKMNQGGTSGSSCGCS
jgi:hypothetical protein